MAQIYSSDPTKVTQFEFYLLEELESYLIVHAPYQSLKQIVQVLKAAPFQITLSSDDLQNCWSLINDSYINDVHLLYPPHIIAVACLFITIFHSGNQPKDHR
ncbi:CGH_1_HP_G0064660.mRNA.1.CDS.1 [Saccharomyces cerevisiae]|nr:CGH_1_HP_G0064660.mRNA.1.CDS.1 [Saccharomyces cerevisiae]CAI6851644.1 CGH_1_HP_G0064660.mRNA.1.CDS.1 [Saccharomyces cerevisiae]